jgi:CubicO group peptidase (beta-lactamase class C family)
VSKSTWKGALRRKGIVLRTFILAIPFLALSVGPREVWSDRASWRAWESSSPEEQGVDSQMLFHMIRAIQEHEYNVRSVIIVRNGAVVLDAYFPPFAKDTWHMIHSCSKSITSALIGIAISKGHIQGVDQPVFEFFPEMRPDETDSLRDGMTLRDLLTMSSGLATRDSYLYKWQGLMMMRGTNDWTRYVLSLPMASAPGERFEYSNCTSYLLSAILQKATGETALAYAKTHMFEPLNIQDVEWESSPRGVNLGWGGIRMRPTDLAKLGMLYLNRGRWDGRQIVPEGWVLSSTRKQIDAGTLSDGYGYQWWVDDAGYYMMLGYGGQFVVVHPARNMVVVFISALRSRDFFVPEALLHNFILPATISSEPLPANPGGFARLDSIMDAVAHPKPRPVDPLPSIARKISGRTFAFDDNRMGYRSMSLSFEPGEPEADIALSFGSKRIKASVGLDGVYRLSESEGHLRAYKGHWEDEHTFSIDYQIVDYTERGSARIRFDRSKVTVWIEGEIQDLSVELTGRLQE